MKCKFSLTVLFLMIAFFVACASSVGEGPDGDAVVPREGASVPQDKEVRFSDIKYPSGQLKMRNFFDSENYESIRETVWYGLDGKMLYRSRHNRPDKPGVNFFLDDQGELTGLHTTRGIYSHGVGVKFSQRGEVEEIALFEGGKKTEVLWIQGDRSRALAGENLQERDGKNDWDGF